MKWVMAAHVGYYEWDRKTISLHIIYIEIETYR